MKKIITLILLAVIVFIGLFQATLFKHKKLFEEICSYKASGVVNTEATDKANKKFFKKCFAGEIFKKMFQGKKYCSKIDKPQCEIQTNDTLLCQSMLRQKSWTKSQQDCELNFACPDLLEDYNMILAGCNK